MILERPYQLTLFGNRETDNNEIVPRPMTSLTISNNEKYCNDTKYYLDGNRWVQFEDNYNKISENAIELLGSDLPCIEKIIKTIDLEHLNVKDDDTPITENDIIWDGDNFVFFTKDKQLHYSSDRIHFSQKNLNDLNGETLHLSTSLDIVSGNSIKLCYNILPDLIYIYNPLRVYYLLPIYVLDDEYNVINSIDLHKYIDGIKFYDGIFYIKTMNIENDETDYIKTVNGTEFESSTPLEYAEADLKKNSTFSYYYDLRTKSETGIIQENLINKQNGNSLAVLSDYSKNEVNPIEGNKIFYITQTEYENGEKKSGYKFISKDGLYGVTLPVSSDFENSIIWYADEYIYISTNDNYYRINTNELKTNILVILNDKILQFKNPPVMESDRILVPMRFLFEQMGANVNWNDSMQTATATVPISAEQQIRTFGMETEKSVTFSIDNINSTVNGQTVTMDVPARLINDQTFVPLRFLSENLGYNVEWDEETNTAIITTE